MKINELKAIPDYQCVAAGSQIVWKTHKGLSHTPVFLHGKLEDEAKFDILYHRDRTTETVELEGDEGLEVISVLINPTSSIKKEVNAYFIWWIPPIEEGYSLLRVRGLVCYPDDVKAIEYAKSKQAEKCVQL